MAAYGWRAGFLAPGAACLLVGLLLLVVLRDRPAAHGLPHPEVLEGGVAPPPPATATRASQVAVLRMPAVWVIAGSCALMYVSRYAINSWAILYLQEAKGYGLKGAGAAMAAYPVAGLLGVVFSGAISDRFFGSDRFWPATLYGACNVGGMALLFWGPSDAMLDTLALGVFGFGIGGLIVFLVGMMAADSWPG